MKINLGTSVSIGKKIIYTLKSLIQPFSNELKTTSDEDDKMAAVIDNAEVKKRLKKKGKNFLQIFRRCQIANI